MTPDDTENHATAPRYMLSIRDGRALVHDPIVNLLTGDLINPWDIKVGHVARDVETGRDLQVTALEYTFSANTAVLTFGDVPVMTPDSVAPVPNVEKTPRRTIRVPDDIWEAAQRIAAERNETLSKVVRDALERYVKRHSR